MTKPNWQFRLWKKPKKNMYSDNAEIILSVKTKDQLDQILREIEEVEQAIYSKNESAFTQLANSNTQKLLGSLLADKDTIESRNSVIESIRENLKKVQTIELMLGIDPSQEMIDKISAWVKKNISEYGVVDIKIDKEIIAGARISYQGRYIDATVNKDWSEFWKRIREEMVVSHD
jgi:F0F1-type ATP synthase delta subunit